MNVFKKFILKACFLGCLISGVSIIASQPETKISAEEVQYLSNIYEHVFAQANQIQSNFHHIIELITSKKVKVDSIEKTRQELLDCMSFLGDQKQINIHLTIDNIYQLTLINKVCLEYFLACIPNKIDTISCQDLNNKVEKFFTDIQSGKQTINNLDQILQENDMQLAKLSYNCDTAGLTQINKLVRYIEQSNALQYAKPAAIVGGATLGIAIILTYAYFQTKNILGVNESGETIFKTEFDTKGLTSITPKILQPAVEHVVNPAMQNVIHPGAQFAQQFGIKLMPTLTGVNALGFLWNYLAPSKKIVQDFTFKKSQEFYNYLRGETGSPKNFLQTTDIKPVYFKDLIGAEHLEKIAQEYIDYLKNPERYDRLGLAPSKAMLLVGPPQTGKSLFAQALLTAIKDEFQNARKVGFIVVDREMLNHLSIEQIFNLAQYNAPCIIFIDEIDMLGADREKNPYQTGQLLTSMSGLNAGSSDKKVFVLAATNKPEQLDFALLQHGRFGKIVPFEYPKLAERTAILQKLIYDKAIILPENFITQLAKETEGLSFNAITSIITEAMRIAKQAARLVTPADIDEAFDKDVRKIAPYMANNENTQSKQAIAAYQAGKAAAYIACNPEQKLAKVTIKSIVKKIEPKAGFEFALKNSSDNSTEMKKDQPFTKESYRLGGVFTYHEINSCQLQNNLDQENEIMCLLAGKISQEMLLGKTYSKVCLEDIEQAKGMIHSLCADPLLTKDEMLKQSHELETKLLKQIENILSNNKALIEKIYKALLEKETLDRDILKKFSA